MMGMMTAGKSITSPGRQLCLGVLGAPKVEFLAASPSCRCQAIDGTMVIFPLESSPGVWGRTLAGCIVPDLQLCSTEPDSFLLLLKPLWTMARRAKNRN